MIVRIGLYETEGWFYAISVYDELIPKSRIYFHRKWNVLSKLVIPRVKLSCHYITSELEEIEREDNFRLKRFKELKIKKNKIADDDKIDKKDFDCVCKRLETDSVNKESVEEHLELEKDKKVCCEPDKGKIKALELIDKINNVSHFGDYTKNVEKKSNEFDKPTEKIKESELICDNEDSETRVYDNDCCNLRKRKAKSIQFIEQRENDCQACKNIFHRSTEFVCNCSSTKTHVERVNNKQVCEKICCNSEIIKNKSIEIINQRELEYGTDNSNKNSIKPSKISLDMKSNTETYCQACKIKLSQNNKRACSCTLTDTQFKNDSKSFDKLSLICSCKSNLELKRNVFCKFCQSNVLHLKKICSCSSVKSDIKDDSNAQKIEEFCNLCKNKIEQRDKGSCSCLKSSKIECNKRDIVVNKKDELCPLCNNKVPQDSKINCTCSSMKSQDEYKKKEYCKLCHSNIPLVKKDSCICFKSQPTNYISNSDVENDKQGCHSQIAETLTKKSNDEDVCSCHSFKENPKICDKPVQTERMSNQTCRCELLKPREKNTPVNEYKYIFSACKNSDKVSCSCQLSESTKELENECLKNGANILLKKPSGICNKISSPAIDEARSRNTISICKSDLIKKEKDISSCVSSNPKIKVSFDNKGIQTASLNDLSSETKNSSMESKTIGKKGTCNCEKQEIYKNDLNSKENLGEFTKTFKEIVKIIRKPDKDGNICEEHKIKTIKTVKKILSKHHNSEDNITQEFTSKHSSNSNSISSEVSKASKKSSQLSKALHTPIENKSSVVTIISQSISIASTDLSNSETETTLNETTSNAAQVNCSKCSSSRKIDQTNYKKSSDSEEPVGSSCVIKITAPPNEYLEKTKSEKVELTPSTFKLIKKILTNLSKSETNKSIHDKFGAQTYQWKDSSENSEDISEKSDIHKNESQSSCKLKENLKNVPKSNQIESKCKCAIKSKKPKSAHKTCSSKDIKNTKICEFCHKNISNEHTPDVFKDKNISKTCVCNKPKVKKPFSDSNCCSINSSQSMDIVRSLKCICTKSDISVNCKESQAESQECSCEQKKRNKSENFECKMKYELDQRKCSCNVPENSNPQGPYYSCKSRSEDKEKESKTCLCKTVKLKDSKGSQMSKLRKCLCKSSTNSCSSTTSNHNLQSSPFKCKSCPKLASTENSLSSVYSTTHEESNSMSQKSLRFSVTSASPTSTRKSCSCTSGAALDDTHSDELTQNSKLSPQTCCQVEERASKSSVCSKCTSRKKDAATSTRRSDKYDVRPLRLLVEMKKLDCFCKSDPVMVKNKNPKPFRPIGRCCSLHNNYYYN